MRLLALKKSDRFILPILVLLVTGVSVRAQNCAAVPATPSASVTTTQDRDRMLCIQGVTFPVLPPRISDPNRPVNSTPTSASNTEGNWTDPRGHVVTRTNFGLWHTYDSDAGLTGGAMSGVGDYGPFSTPRYTDIDLLKMKDGTPVLTPEDWWTKRRPEIFNLVQQELYGRPIDASFPITWVVGAVTTGTTVVGGVSYPWRQKTITGTVSKASYPALRNTPVVTAQCRYPAATGRQYPIVITYGEGTGIFQYTAPYNIGTCSYNPTSVQPDSGGGNLSSYIIGLVNQGDWRDPEDPGSLVAWGWGASRLIDYFALDADFDETHVGVEGHSRYGKSALVAAAYDERFTVAWPSDAGAMGTAMARRNYGETLEFVSTSTSEYHWVNGRIMTYGGALTPGTYFPRRLELLDVDAHSTTSLIAPRAIFATNGTDTPPGLGDAWADPRGCFLSGKLASPAWELLGWPGQIIPAGTVFTSGPDESIGGTPPFNTAFIAGTVGWRRQIEGHTPVPNWPTFALFASRFLNDNRPVVAPKSFNLSARSGFSVGTMEGTDADASDVLSQWQIKGGDGVGLFKINPATGEITVPDLAALDTPRTTPYKLIVAVGDGKLMSNDTEVSINVSIQLVTTATLARLDDGSYQATVKVTNNGARTAESVTLTGATLGSAGGSVPQSLGNIAPGGFATTTVNFPASAGSPGAAVVEKYSGNYTGGSFAGSIRAALP